MALMDPDKVLLARCSTSARCRSLAGSQSTGSTRAVGRTITRAEASLEVFPLGTTQPAEPVSTKASTQSISTSHSEADFGPY